jgi:nucleotide-binding universal stress UspA family protein
MAFKRILVAVDGSPLGAHAVDIAIELAKDLQAGLAFVYVVDPRQAATPEAGMPASALLEIAREEGREALEAAISRAPVEPPPWKFLKEGTPVAEIVSAATEWQGDLIVVDSHGRGGLKRTVLGSTSDGVVRL